MRVIITSKALRICQDSGLHLILSVILLDFRSGTSFIPSPFYSQDSGRSRIFGRRVQAVTAVVHVVTSCQARAAEAL